MELTSHPRMTICFILILCLECLTKSGPSNNVQCVFPFIYKRRKRYRCIQDGDPKNRAWCSTMVDASGRHMKNGGHWGHCAQNCPKSGNWNLLKNDHKNGY